MNTIKLQINTNNHKYPIIIGSNLIAKLSKLLNYNSIKFNKCLLVIDNKIPKNLINKLTNSLPKKKTIIYLFNANELNKNQLSVNKILKTLLKNNFNRNDCLISVGGGITGERGRRCRGRVAGSSSFRDGFGNGLGGYSTRSSFRF